MGECLLTFALQIIFELWVAFVYRKLTLLHEMNKVPQRLGWLSCGVHLTLNFKVKFTAGCDDSFIPFGERIAKKAKWIESGRKKME